MHTISFKINGETMYKKFIFKGKDKKHKLKLLQELYLFIKDLAFDDKAEFEVVIKKIEVNDGNY